jgi:hypothetical protein
MKRTILLTMLALSLTVGSSSVYASGHCQSCTTSYAAISPWQQVMLVLSSVYSVALSLV